MTFKTAARQTLIGTMLIAGTIALAGCGSDETVIRTTTTEHTTTTATPTNSSTSTITTTQQDNP